MRILSDSSEDVRTPKPVPGSYEWWYFDAQSDDGFSIVIIFYEGNPFSRRYIEAIESGEKARASDYPALSISVYRESEPVFYSFREMQPGEADFSPDEPRGRAEDSSFGLTVKNGMLVYTVKLREKVSSGDEIDAELSFSSPDHKRILQEGSADENHAGHSWNLVQPKAIVTGNIRISGYTEMYIPFSGTGYHDHNFGSEPMKDSFREWYWGRYHFAGSTLVYYIMNQNESWKQKGWLIDDNGAVTPATEIILRDKGLSFFGLNSSRKIEVKSDSYSIHLQKSSMIDSGPFYQRFTGEAVLERDGKLEKAAGISEYIYPSRIYSRIFWPLVNMRISYPGTAHWVQKSPVLYRWTW
jgi:carotenoid 1,2-hydratase